MNVKPLERRLADAQKGGTANALTDLLGRAKAVGGARLVAGMVTAADVKALQALGDAMREGLGSGVALLGAAHDDGKCTLLVVVTDDLRDKGVCSQRPREGHWCEDGRAWRRKAAHGAGRVCVGAGARGCAAGRGRHL